MGAYSQRCGLAAPADAGHRGKTMNKETERLIASAKEARALSYCPYSNKSVGAAILTDSGRIYKGANIENASFGATVCAERAALITALMSGEHSFCAMAIEGGDRAEAAEGFFTPCGICRQVLAEFCSKDFKIYVSSCSGVKELTLGELLPEAFSL